MVQTKARGPIRLSKSMFSSTSKGSSKSSKTVLTGLKGVKSWGSYPPSSSHRLGRIINGLPEVLPKVRAGEQHWTHIPNDLRCPCCYHVISWYYTVQQQSNPGPSPCSEKYHHEEHILHIRVRYHNHVNRPSSIVTSGSGPNTTNS